MVSVWRSALLLVSVLLVSQLAPEVSSQSPAMGPIGECDLDNLLRVQSNPRSTPLMCIKQQYASMSHRRDPWLWWHSLATSKAIAPAGLHSVVLFCVPQHSESLCLLQSSPLQTQMHTWFKTFCFLNSYMHVCLLQLTDATGYRFGSVGLSSCTGTCKKTYCLAAGTCVMRSIALADGSCVMQSRCRGLGHGPCRLKRADMQALQRPPL